MRPALPPRRPRHGLWAAACPNLAYLTDGLELAQSWSVDAHKTLNAPYDSGLSLCADPEAMVAALQNSGAYIPTSEHRDGMQFTPEMSRRTRAIDLWAALSFLGRSGVATLVEGLHARARQFEAELKQAGFSVINDVVFNQVLMEIGDEAKTTAFVDHVKASGEAWIGPSRWFDRPVVRVSLCSWATTPADVTRAVAAFVAARDQG
ncbi:MAG: pyridoxal-dependent decarboxylase [Alphaproteobacteria bacterium]